MEVTRILKETLLKYSTMSNAEIKELLVKEQVLCGTAGMASKKPEPANHLL
ncbi:hypothetical protein FHS19_006276 [Paenibacillus rhizosphaerae]|uniref:Uncharacterized protein n=1 Tax=Paenibacillus rhizosphaerae TaxID=297318 RepID=A0A839TYI4_9BACL|nr:hypothetical protein [Paenibacillus rhizosphaerae]